ncbi:MAG: polymerase, sigma-24 subunit, subfamily [Frankiales bacterium]|nr:polymerase, sigma-24 subunit, subfamily [Frankiales bacterium]
MDEHSRDEFRTWVAARSGVHLRTAYLLTGSRSDAEDLLQTALAKTYLAWDRVREREALDGYVRRVMVNTQTSFWRRRRVDERSTASLPEHGGRDLTADLDLHDALWAALSGLPARQRAAVVLRYYEDLSEAETAAVLGVSVGTVKSSTSRALAKLRDDASLRDDPRLTVGAP